MNFQITFDVSRKGNAKAMLDRVVRSLSRQRGGRNVKVGFPAGQASGDIIAIAVYNHEGTSRGIPPRPFITTAMFRGRGEFVSVMRAEARALLTGRSDIERVLPRLGILGQQQIQDTIGSNMPPPNAASTIRQKGSSKTLINTGRMRQSVTWAIE